MLDLHTRECNASDIEGFPAIDSISNIPPPPALFADVLRSLRVAAELTQEELSERSGVSVRAISDLERGAKTRPQRATVDLLVQGLELDEVQRLSLEAAVPSRHRLTIRPNRSLDLPVGGFLGAVPDGTLVARSSEISHVRGIVDAVAHGSGRVLLLSGEPGVGKTRLAQEITVICRARGMYLAAGQCDEPHQNAACYPFLDMLRQLVTVARSGIGIEPLERWPALRPLMPFESRSVDSDSALPAGEGDQRRLFWAVTEMITALASGAPIVVALDDLHWADQASLALLHHLARQLRDAPVLMLGAYRDTEVSRRLPLRRTLLDLHREHLSEQVVLSRLDHDGTAAIISSLLGGQPVAPAFIDLVQRHTDGNPFFVEEIVRTLVERGDAFEESGEWSCRAVAEISIPGNVFEAISERLARISAGTQGVLVEASVLGSSFEFDDLLAMGERTEAELDAALEEAVRSSLIGFGQGDGYAFHHALIQQVLYRGIPPQRRKRLHLAAGQAIEQQPDHLRQQRAAELVGHFRRAGAPDPAMRYALIAGDQAESRFAHQEAQRNFRDALELARANGDDQIEVASLEKVGRVLTNIGQYEDARRSLEQALPLFRRSGEWSGEVRTTVQLGSTYRAMGRAGDAIELINDLLGRIGQAGQPQDVAELNIVLETLYYATGRYRDGLGAAERAVQIARDIDDMPALARALTGYGTELNDLGRLDEGLAALEEAIALPVAADDPFNLVRALDNASIGYRSRGNVIRSQELSQRSLEVAERIQSPWDTAVALAGLGACYRALGEWQQASEYLERGIALQHGMPSAWWAIFAIQELGGLCVDRGELERASQLLLDGLSIARRAGFLTGIRDFERTLAEIDLLQGRPARARDRLIPLLDRPGLEELMVTELLPTLAAAYEATGERSQAEAIIEEAIRRARQVNGVWALCLALTVRGRLLTAVEQWNEAERDLDEAVRLARSMPYPYLEARALYEWGDLHQREGDQEAARKRLLAALTIFERLGAQPYIERCEEALSSLSA